MSSPSRNLNMFFLISLETSENFIYFSHEKFSHAVQTMSATKSVQIQLNQRAAGGDKPYFLLTICPLLLHNLLWLLNACL